MKDFLLQDGEFGFKNLTIMYGHRIRLDATETRMPI